MKRMTMLLSNNDRFCSRKFGIPRSRSIDLEKKETVIRRLRNYFLGFIISLLPLVSIFLLYNTAHAEVVSTVSTTDFYYFYQYIISLFAAGIKMIFDLFISIFAEFFILLSSLLAVFFIAYSVSRKKKTEKGESPFYTVKKQIRENKKIVVRADRFFITFSKFLS